MYNNRRIDTIDYFAITEIAHVRTVMAWVTYIHKENDYWIYYYLAKSAEYNNLQNIKINGCTRNVCFVKQIKVSIFLVTYKLFVLFIKLLILFCLLVKPAQSSCRSLNHLSSWTFLKDVFNFIYLKLHFGFEDANLLSALFRTSWRGKLMVFLVS